jgi:hypothetical protein
MDMVEARFTLNEKKEVWQGNESSRCCQMLFAAVYNNGKGNESWAKATPVGQITMTVTNPAAIDFFKIGKTYRLMFEEAPAQ